MIDVDYELIYEFEGGAVYRITWTVGNEKGSRMMTVYEGEGEDG
jgi:hypothetical protein